MLSCTELMPCFPPCTVPSVPSVFVSPVNASDDAVQFTCFATGVPIPTVSWFLRSQADGTDTPFTGRVIFSDEISSSVQSQVTIPIDSDSFTFFSSNTLFCQANNSIGTALDQFPPRESNPAVCNVLVTVSASFLYRVWKWEWQWEWLWEWQWIWQWIWQWRGWTRLCNSPVPVHW